MKKYNKPLINIRKNVFKLSQAKFALMLDTPLRTLQDWEYGISYPPTPVIMLLEHAAESFSLWEKLMKRVEK